MSKLFCFGLGYSAEALSRRLASNGWQIAGTSRAADKTAHHREPRLVARTCSTAPRALKLSRTTSPTRRTSSSRQVPATRATRSHLLCGRSRHGKQPALDRLPLDHRRLWRHGRRLGRRGNRAPAPTSAARHTPGRSRTPMAGFRRSAPESMSQVFPSRRHLWIRTQRHRRPARRNGTAHHQTWPGVQPHPCRGHRQRACSPQPPAADRARDVQCHRRPAAPPQDVIEYAAELLGVPPPLELPFETADLSPMARSLPIRPTAASATLA